MEGGDPDTPDGVDDRVDPECQMSTSVCLIASVGASFTPEVLSDAFWMEKLQNFGTINYRTVAILHHECAV